LITSLGAPAGPAVEFLDYLAPATGRPARLDTQANDLWHWQIRMETPDLDALEQTLREAGAAFVSPGIVEMPDDDLALGWALMVRSPVGHAVLITQAR
jgi:hypothetical protein